MLGNVCHHSVGSRRDRQTPRRCQHILLAVMVGCVSLLLKRERGSRGHSRKLKRSMLLLHLGVELVLLPLVTAVTISTVNILFILPLFDFRRGGVSSSGASFQNVDQRV